MRTARCEDPNGNVTERTFNARGHEVAHVVQTVRNVNPHDPPSFTTTRTWNADSLVTSITYPEGNSVQFDYDSTNPRRFAQGNLLRVTQAPGERGGDQTALVTTYTYEPIYNRVRTVTTPRGHDASFEPATPDDYSSHRSQSGW